MVKEKIRNYVIVQFGGSLCLEEQMDEPIERRYVSLTEAAIYLGLSVKTLYGWAEKHRIPAYKVGRVWRLDKQELDDFIKRGAPEFYNLPRSEPGRRGV